MTKKELKALKRYSVVIIYESNPNGSPDIVISGSYRETSVEEFSGKESVLIKGASFSEAKAKVMEYLADQTRDIQLTRKFFYSLKSEDVND